MLISLLYISIDEKSLMHGKNASDFYCNIEIAVANMVGTVTIAANNVVDKTDSLNRHKEYYDQI